MMSFLCPLCRQTLSVAEERAGGVVRCPSCQQALRVPGQPIAVPAEEVGSLKTLPPDGAEGRRAAAGVALPAEYYDFLAPAQAADEIGRLGSYRVLKVLGVGGMGVVFHAEDSTLHRLVALKIMLPALAASGANKERFLREARAAAAIEHDHIVSIFEVDEDRGVPFIAMPLLRGESLEQRLKRERRLPVEEVVRIARETALGLTAAHERGLVHRDIKPANIWLEGDKGRVKILDFGLARRRGDDANLTQQGAILGTPAYMAPEQASGRPVDMRADLFSLGCVMYRLSTGRPAFQGADAVATLVAVATEQPPPPHQLIPDLPPALSRLIMQLLAKAPGDRPASARAVVAALEAIEREPLPAAEEANEPTLVEASDAEGQPSRKPPLWPWLAAAGGLACAMLVGVIFLVILIRQMQTPTRQTVESPRQASSVPAGDKAVSAPNDEKQPKKRRPPKQPRVPVGDRDRAAAEWATSYGPNNILVGVRPNDGSREFGTNSHLTLPKGPFHVYQIWLAGKPITDDELENITGLTQLEWLNLKDTDITDEGLEYLRDLPKLYILELQGTKVTDAGVERLRAALPAKCQIKR
jgi:serine/threonine protein kinase